MLLHKESDTLHFEVVGDWGSGNAMDSVVHHEPDRNLVFNPLNAICRLWLWVYVNEMANVMLILFEIGLEVSTKFAGVLWLFHDDSEAVEIVIVDLRQIDALEPTEHVVDRHESSLILLEMTFHFEVRLVFFVDDLKRSVRDATVLRAI